MLNSMMLLNIFCFVLEIPFLGKFCPKTQNCLLKLKFVTKTISNLLNSIVMLNSSVLDQKWPFSVTLVRKPKMFL